MKQISILLSFFLLGINSLSAQENYFKTVKISDSIYAFIPSDQLDDIVDGNSVAIIGREGVLVIDTYNKSHYATEMVKRLKKITTLPVKYIVITHWHGDHNLGTGSFKKAYPNAIVIAHPETKIGMDKNNAPEVVEIHSGYLQYMEMFGKRISTGKAEDGREFTAYEKKRNQKTLDELKKIISYKHEYSYVAPDFLFNDSLKIDLGNEVVELFHTPQAHSKGDVLAWIPSKKILVTGDLIVNPIPYAFNAHHPNWISILQRIKTINPTFIIPGHGEVQKDLSYVDQLLAMLNDLETEFDARIAQKPTEEELKKQLTLEKHRQLFAGNDEERNWAFDNYFRIPSISSHYKKWKTAQPK